MITKRIKLDQALECALLLAFSLFLNGCQTAISVKALKPFTSYGQSDQKLPMRAGLLLPDTYVKELPRLRGDDLGVWPWFFDSQMRSCFSETTRIQDLNALKSDPSIQIVVKPELWGWDGQGYMQMATTWLNFKYRIFDRNGTEIGSFMTEGYTQDKDMIRSFGYCMTESAGYFRTEINGPQKELIMKDHQTNR